jgi:predicted acetyltransferase
MNEIVLRELSEADEALFLAGLEDWAGEDLTWYSFEWKPGVTYSEMLERLRKNRLGVDLPSGFVPSTLLYGFTHNAVVGRVHIRHSLNAHLLHRGGHIGYAVAPRYRGLGYATSMVRQGLDFCRTRLAMGKILITCADDNKPSWKIIEKLGGQLENKVLDEVDQELIRRYWISVTHAGTGKDEI